MTTKQLNDLLSLACEIGLNPDFPKASAYIANLPFHVSKDVKLHLLALAWATNLAKKSATQIHTIH